MARTLRETLQQQLEQPPQAPQLGQTEEAQRLLGAKTGKATGPGTAPRRSAQKERMQQQQTRLAGRQQATKGALAGLGIQEQEQGIQEQQQQQLADIEERRKNIDSVFDRRADEIADQLARGRKELGTQKYVSGMEQVGIVARLENDKYIYNLQAEGRRNRLDSELAFKEAFARDKFSDMASIFRDDIAFKQMMDMDKREFAEQLAHIDINAAIEAARDARKQQQTAMIFQGVGELIEMPGDAIKVMSQAPELASGFQGGGTG